MRFGTTTVALFATALIGLTSGCSSAEEMGATSDEAPLTVDADKAQRVLFLDAAAPTSCAALQGEVRVRCLIEARYSSDAAARDVALDLFRMTGGVAGVGPAQQIDGGYRGHIQLVPELPVGAYKKHLVWARDAMRDFERFFAGITPASTQPPQYRWRGVDFRFFRSVGRTTPSAFVEGEWEVFYNVSGSLVSSADAVRETLFHELFHVNDWAHGSWSSRALAPIVNDIVAKCGTRAACLAPFTPTSTQVRGGTYYAFQPNQNPIEIEYSAELAIRYYDEQRAVLDGRRPSQRAFKCGPPENKRAWDLLVNEFFGGADLVPQCDR